jgi:hypothetical protein
MKKIVLLILFLAAYSSFYSQTEVTIGTGTDKSGLIPINRYYNYSVWEAIYLSSEIGQSGEITTI